MMKNMSRIKCLIGICCTVFLLLGSALTAVAGLATFSPGTLPAGTLFPLAITSQVADQRALYQDENNSIQITWGSNVGQSIGGWTNFSFSPVQTVSAASVIPLITSGNPVPISIGTAIGTTGGEISAALDRVPTGVDVILPVISAPGNNIGNASTVYGFIGFHITDKDSHIDNYIEGYFLNSILVNGGSGIAPDNANYGVRSPVVPIPGAVWLLGSGLIGLIGIRRFRK